MKKVAIMTMAMVIFGSLYGQQAAAMAVPSLLMGTRTVALRGWIGDDGEDVEVYMTGSYGYFIKDFQQIGGYLGLDIYGSDYKAISTGVYAEHNFDLGGQIVPYAGVSAGLVWEDTPSDNTTAIEATGYGGARYFFADYAAVGSELVVGAATEDIYNYGQDAIDWAIYFSTSWFY